MIDIFKVIGVSLIGVIATMFLKDARSEFGILTLIATGLVVLIIIINSLGDVVMAFGEIVDVSGIDKQLFDGVLRMIGIGYITEYASSICEDFGAKSIAKKIELSSKIAIFLMSMPLVMALLESVAYLVRI